MGVYTTEIASDKITSDNPIHQRLLMPYEFIADKISGNVLEVGCGEGRGIETVKDKVDHYTGIDKITELTDQLQKKYPKHKFISANIPPFSGLEDNQFDFIFSFQVIEHIKDDKAYLEEIYRVLKKGGTAWLTTPNRPMSLSRNPWHEREYTQKELHDLCASIFPDVKVQGITGNEPVFEYYEANKKSVNRIMRWDIFNLQYRLPASWLRKPYEFLNRRNRNKLQDQDENMVTQITTKDFSFADDAVNSFDLFCILKK